MRKVLLEGVGPIALASTRVEGNSDLPSADQGVRGWCGSVCLEGWL